MTLDPLAGVIARMIISTEIPAGAHLTAAALADRLGVSRTPVREALQAVAASGLVDHHGNRGVFVVDPTALSPDDLVDLVATRRQIEPWALGQAARRRSDDDIASIDEALDAGRDALRHGRTGDLNLAHHALLTAVTDAAHNPSASLALAPLHYRTCLVFARVAFIVLREGWPQHEAVRHAIVMGDSERAESLHRDHLDEVIASLQRGD